MKALGNKVIITPLTREESRIGAIALPNADGLDQGMVHAAGDGDIVKTLSPGDTIFYGHGHGVELMHDGRRYLILDGIHIQVVL